jgi:hypothetical protein
MVKALYATRCAVDFFPLTINRLINLANSMLLKRGSGAVARRSARRLLDIDFYILRVRLPGRGEAIRLRGGSGICCLNR